MLDYRSLYRMKKDIIPKREPKCRHATTASSILLMPPAASKKKKNAIFYVVVVVACVALHITSYISIHTYKKSKTMKSSFAAFILMGVTTFIPIVAFAPIPLLQQRPTFTSLHAEDTEKAAPIITGEELERMLTEWDTPLVVDGT
jgi:hypothetical protein